VEFTGPGCEPVCSSPDAPPLSFRRATGLFLPTYNQESPSGEKAGQHPPASSELGGCQPSLFASLDRTENQTRKFVRLVSARHCQTMRIR